jgi:hypothetical protein
VLVLVGGWRLAGKFHDHFVQLQLEGTYTSNGLTLYDVIFMSYWPFTNCGWSQSAGEMMALALIQWNIHFDIKIRILF